MTLAFVGLNVWPYFLVVVFAVLLKNNNALCLLRMRAFCFVTSSLCFFQFVCVESLVTAVVDMYPETFRRGYRRELLILGMSITSFLIGLIMCTEVRRSLGDNRLWCHFWNPRLRKCCRPFGGIFEQTASIC